MQRSGSGQPIVLATDILPVIDWGVQLFGGYHPNRGGLYAPTDGFTYYTQEVANITGATVNVVQKIIGRMTRFGQISICLDNADAFCVAADTTLASEKIPVYFPAQILAAEAVETFEWLKGITLRESDHKALAQELWDIGRAARRGNPFRVSRLALSIMGGDPCQATRTIRYRYSAATRVPDRQPTRRPQRSGGNTLRRRAARTVKS